MTTFTLLLIDDDTEILDFLERVLQGEYTIVKTTTALDGLAIAEKNLVDLIVSDVMMPEIDGFELLRRLKSSEHTSHIPVVLLTAKNTLESKITGLELKADAYIEKPFSKEHLLAQIKSLIHNRISHLESILRYPLMHLKKSKTGLAEKKFLEQLHEVILSNLEDDKLDVGTLARYMNMSRGSLYRHIKLYTDSSAAKLIYNMRLKRGAELLASGDYKIYEIAMMIGYTSPSNFARDFLKMFNITPSAFIRSNNIK